MEPTEIESPLQQPVEPATPSPIAPAWHAVVLITVIVALSIHGALRVSVAHHNLNRLATYGFSAMMEASMIAWVIFGLHLKNTSLRSLLGPCSFNLRSILADLGYAVIFWIASMTVLGTLGMAWSSAEASLTRRPPTTHADGLKHQAPDYDSSQMELRRTLRQLAPTDGREIAAWTLLCLLVGFCEEIVFRGYLQRQFIGWARGRVALGVLASALVFGSAHAYEGARGIVLIFVFGVLFSLLALYRRSLRAGIFAHSWHDLIAGLTLALLKSKHLL